jgi:hypothetical protein
VATVTLGYPGNYTVVPTNPVAQGSTSGGGSGCTLNITYVAQFSASLVTNEAGALPWQRLGASAFVSGLMAKVTGLDFANAIGGSNLSAAIGGNLVNPPRGILSTVNSTTAPVPTTDQTAVTRIYWTPYSGNSVPIYNGVSFVAATSAQIFCDLTAGAQVAAGIYDVYMFLNAGTPTLGFSPSWAAGAAGSVTAGSCARGTGAGGTALTIVGGLYVNAAQQTVNNAASTFTVAVNQGTYLGSIFVDPASAGHLNCHVGFGQSRQWGLWNAYQRRPIYLKCGDGTASWTPGAGPRPVNNTVANNLTIFQGLAEDPVNAFYLNRVQLNPGVANTSQSITASIGFNSTSASSGMTGLMASDINATGFAPSIASAQYRAAPVLGISVITALETSSLGAQPGSMFGTEANMLLSAEWRA